MLHGRQSRERIPKKNKWYSSMGKVYYPYLDLLKFICCIGIVGIHTWPFNFAPDLLKYGYAKICPAFASIFFIVSSMLFLQKLKFNESDWSKLGHFCKRLVILLGCWSVLLAPHWLSTFIRHNPDDWYLWLFPKILTTGTAHGAWFVMALIYGTIICYLLNRFFNRHIVFVFVFLIWLYFSLVKWGYIMDFLGIYLQGDGDGFHLDSFYLPTRSIFWIETAYYLLPMLARKHASSAAMMAICGGATLLVLFTDEYTFVFNAIIAICLSAICAKVTTKEKNPKFVYLRKISIIIYFVHFVPVTIFHVLYIEGMIPYEYGLLEFLIVFTLTFTVAGMIVYASNKYKFLKYLY